MTKTHFRSLTAIALMSFLSVSASANAAGYEYHHIAHGLQAAILFKEPIITVSDASLAFGTVADGQSAVKTLTLTNQGKSSSLSITVPAGFSIQTTCSAGLANKASCTLDVSFNPISPVQYTGNLLVKADGATLQTVSLSGMGKATDYVIDVYQSGGVTKTFTIPIGVTSALFNFTSAGCGSSSFSLVQGGSVVAGQSSTGCGGSGGWWLENAPTYINNPAKSRTFYFYMSGSSYITTATVRYRY